MASITKTLTGRIQSISVANRQVYTGIEWVDASAEAAAPKNPSTPAELAQSRLRPLGRTQIRIEGDKIFANNVEVGSVATGTSASATSLVASIKATLEGLVAAGKISL